MPTTTSSHDEGSHGRGFASMPKEEVKKIARKGGQASHKKSTSRSGTSRSQSSSASAAKKH